MPTVTTKKPTKKAAQKKPAPKSATAKKPAARAHAPARTERISTNPATGEDLGSYPVFTPDEVRAAIARARAAQPRWAAFPLAKRIEFMKRVKRDILNHMGDLAELISKESGKPRVEAHNAEIILICDLIDYFSKEAPKLLADEKLPMPQVAFKTKSTKLFYAPLGVIGIISPWNWPFAIPMSEIIMALICGNTVVLKPAEPTSLCGLRIGELFDRAGVPEGVVEVVSGSGSTTGQALVEGDVDKVVFTGSVEVGRHIMETAAKRLCPAVLELGGKDPMIICEDAYLNAAAEAAVWGAFFNQGQVCASVERVYVHETVYDEFVDLVVEKAGKLRVGNPMDPDVDLGSMINHAQVKTVHAQVQRALKAGARVLTGGEPVEPVKGGAFYSPTVMVDVRQDMEIMQEETFGPVLPIMKFTTDEEAVALANDSRFGLSASVFSKNLKRAELIARQIRTGAVSINDCCYTYGLPQAPWGGEKESGVGRTHSRFGLYEFVSIRSLGTEMLGQVKRPYWYPYSQGTYEMLQKATSLLYSDSPLEGVLRILGSGKNGG